MPFENQLFVYVSVMQFFGKRWRIPEMYNFYKWSDRYGLTYQGMDHTSVARDEFIVVIRKSDSQIGMAYNTKFFEWKE